MLVPQLADALNDAVVAGARSSFSARGRGNRNEADRLAVEAMRFALESSSFGFEVVVGEGEKDEAPLLYVGEVLGNSNLSFDLAVDPLEGTNYVAKGQAGAVSVLACSARGSMRRLPGYYMQKCVVARAAKGAINLEDAPDVTVAKVADALGKDVSEVVVAVLDKPRHRELIDQIRSVGARVVQVAEGDVVAAFEVLTGGFDLLLGVGGAPEGVIMAALANALGGEFQGSLAPQSDAERQMIEGLDPEVLGKTFFGVDLCPIDVVVAMASVTGTSTMPAPLYEGEILKISSVTITNGEVIQRVTR